MRYVQILPNGKCQLLYASDIIKVKRTDVSVVNASRNPRKTGVYKLGYYDETKYYPANFSLNLGVVKYQLVPNSWEYPEKGSRILANINLLNTEVLGQKLHGFLEFARLQGLGIEPNGVPFVCQIYYDTLEPSYIEEDLISITAGFYKLDDSGRVILSDTKIDETYKQVFGDPHDEGLIVIQKLKDMLG